MDYKLTKGKSSNYQIALTVTAEEMASYKKKALQEFQKEMDVPGFRKGNVPLDMVEKKVSPEYLQMGQLEEAVHQGTQQLLEENKEIKFIGSIYDLNKEEKDGDMHVTFKLDVYPELEEKNKNWKKATPGELDTTATKEEVDDAIDNLRKQYAEYQPVDEATEKTLTKVKFQHTDKDGKEVDDGTVFIGPEEMEEFSELKNLFVGKKQNDTFEIPYKEESLPPMLHNRKEDKESANIAFEIQDVRETKLPELNEETIKKLFGNDEVKTEEDLKKKIKELIENQKQETALMQAIDKYLDEVKSSFDLVIPRTLIQEEMKSRIKSLQERMGGEEGFQKYIEKIGKEEQQKMMKDIEQAAQQSLAKFFLLKYIVEEVGIKDPNRKEPLDVEKKLYEKLTSKK